MKPVAVISVLKVKTVLPIQVITTALIAVALERSTKTHIIKNCHLTVVVKPVIMVLKMEYYILMMMLTLILMMKMMNIINEYKLG